jgi:hypothetical protein
VVKNTERVEKEMKFKKKPVKNLLQKLFRWKQVLCTLDEKRGVFNFLVIQLLCQIEWDYEKRLCLLVSDERRWVWLI